MIGNRRRKLVFAALKAARQPSCGVPLHQDKRKASIYILPAIEGAYRAVRIAQNHNGFDLLIQEGENIVSQGLNVARQLGILPIDKNTTDRRVL